MSKLTDLNYPILNTLKNENLFLGVFKKKCLSKLYFHNIEPNISSIVTISCQCWFKLPHILLRSHKHYNTVTVTDLSALC